MFRIWIRVWEDLRHANRRVVHTSRGGARRHLVWRLGGDPVDRCGTGDPASISRTPGYAALRLDSAWTGV